MSPRSRVVREEVLAEGGVGPIRTKLIAQNEALGVFSTRERRAILLAAAQRMGAFWLAVFLPKRFDLTYAKENLRYSVTDKYQKTKDKLFAKPQALVWKGELIESANSATAVGRVGPNGPSVTIRIPMPAHRLADVVRQELNTIPNSEVKAMAGELEKKLVSLMKGADDAPNERKRLTAGQRQALGLSKRGRPAGKYSRGGSKKS